MTRRTMIALGILVLLLGLGGLTAGGVTLWFKSQMETMFTVHPERLYQLDPIERVQFAGAMEKNNTIMVVGFAGGGAACLLGVALLALASNFPSTREWEASRASKKME